MATDDDNSKYARFERTRLYLAALKGDWESLKDMPNIQREITIKKETTLHIAAAANKEKFVYNLVAQMNPNDLEALNIVGNTAMSYVAATGNVNIAKAMLEKNMDLANLGCVKPLFMAALLGHHDMVDFLCPVTRIREWDTTEQAELFVTYVSVGMYGKALEMLKFNPTIATVRNKENETALHVLATKPSIFDSGSQPGILRRYINSITAMMVITQDQNLKQTGAHQLLQEICAQAYQCDFENLTVNEEISQLLFVAAKVGNVDFLIELIRTDIDLIWNVDTQGRTIFHIALEERHESICNIFVNEIGSIKDILLDHKTKDGNNMLHLAAKLAPERKLNAISGAALQMQQELLWFKEVEKVVRPSFKKMKNEQEQTPYDLFVEEHDRLRKNGEKWMRKTATSSMIVATLIATIMFIGQIIFSGQPADGLNHSSEKSNLVRAFSYSSAIALVCSSTSAIMFLSILTSRYSYDDFLVSLPNMLLIGVTSLFFSIATMMVAFCALFFFKYPNRHGFTLIGLFACLPILYGLLKYRLLYDIVRFTYCSSSLFQSRQRLLC